MLKHYGTTRTRSK